MIFGCCSEDGWKIVLPASTSDRMELMIAASRWKGVLCGPGSVCMWVILTRQIAISWDSESFTRTRFRSPKCSPFPLD